MSIYNGIFNTTKNPTELNAKSLSSHIMRRQPNGSAPLYALMSRTARSKATQSTHGYFSKTLEFSRVVTSALAAAAATTLTVASTAGIVPFQVLHNPVTGENLRVLTVASATSITVTRGFGRVAAAEIASGVTLVVIGTAHAEGSPRPVERAIASVYVPNFTQIFRNAWGLTETARASLSELGYSNVAESQRDAMTFHSIDIESAMFFGQAKMDTTGSQPLHATQGIIDAVRQYAPNNVEAATNPVSYDDIVDMTEGAFAYSHDMGDTKSRVAYCDSVAMKTMQRIGKQYADTLTMTQGESSVGMHFTEFRTWKGVLYLVEHPLFNGLAMNQGLMVVVDVPAVKLAILGDRDAKPENYGLGGTNAQGAVVQPGVDSTGGSFTSELAVEVLNPQGCAVITGLTAAKERVIHTFSTNP